MPGKLAWGAGTIAESGSLQMSTGIYDASRDV
jgi:hypothetical protein